MHHNRGDDTFTAWVIAEDRLCAIDAYTAVCYEEKVETWEGNTNFKIANAAVFVGDDYYYGRDYPQYWVSGVPTGNPVFHSNDFICHIDWRKKYGGRYIGSALVMDFASLLENDEHHPQAADSLVVDSDGVAGNYIVGLGKFNVLYVFSINNETNVLDKYAAIVIDDDDVKWNWHEPSTLNPQRTAPRTRILQEYCRGSSSIPTRATGCSSLGCLSSYLHIVGTLMETTIPDMSTINMCYAGTKKELRRTLRGAQKAQ